MIRNLKVLGLSLVAVFALGAVMASGAMAQNGLLTADGPFYLTGTDEATGNALTYPGEEPLVCPGSHYKGEKEKSSAPLTSGSSAITVTPTYTNCAGGGLPATVVMNGCDYLFHVGATTGVADQYSLTADLECPAGKVVEVSIYSSGSHALRLCKITFGAQAGLAGGVVTDKTNGIATVGGTFTGIKAVKSGLCGGSETAAAEYHVAVELSGENEAGTQPTTVTLSHT